jgi:hypothetical protein
MDVKNVFFHEYFQKEMYMKQPLNYVNQTNVNLVYKLKKILHGLKQALKTWLNKIGHWLNLIKSSTCDKLD